MPKSTSPSSSRYLQLEQLPWREPYFSRTPWRRAAPSTLSPGSTSKLRPSGVSWTWWISLVSATGGGSAGGRAGRLRLVPLEVAHLRGDQEVVAAGVGAAHEGGHGHQPL